MSGAKKQYMFKTIQGKGFVADHDSNQYKRTTKKQMLDSAVSELNRLKKLIDDIGLVCPHTEDYYDIVLVDEKDFVANETRDEYQQEMFDRDLDQKDDKIKELEGQLDQQHKELQEIKSQVKSLLGLVS